MSKLKEEYLKRMIEIYGSEEAYKEVRRNAGKKSKGISKRSHLSDNPEKAAELGRMGAKARYGK